MTTPISPDTPALPFPATKRAHGRSLADFGELLPAEQKLLDCCVTGEEAKVGDAVPFDDPDPKTIVRADFLRFLLLGGDEQAPVHERGVQLIGAWIAGELDFGNCVLPHGMALVNCKVDGPIIAFDAHIVGLLDLSGSYLRKGLQADRLRCNSSVFLLKDFLSLGGVSLVSAQIGGDLDCSGGQFKPKEGDALYADGIIVKGSVFLNEGFKAIGKVRLIAAQIDRDLSCSGGQFESEEGEALSADGIVVKGSVLLNEGFKATGEVRLVVAQIGLIFDCSGGQFEPKEGEALSADGAVVKGSVYLCEGFKATATVRLLGAQICGSLSCVGGEFSAGTLFGLNLQAVDIRNGLLLGEKPAPARINAVAAMIGTLVDESDAWAKGSILDGFVYKSLGGMAPTDAATRIEWLKKQMNEDLGEDASKRNFRPQPWKQLQKVLREMGHDTDARAVGVAYENQLRKADRIGQITDVKNGDRWIPFLRRKCLRALHWLFGFLAGYGYHPLRLFMSLVGVWLFFGVIYWSLAYAPHNAIGPTDPLVFQNAAYAACAKENNGNWMLCEQLPAEYTTFSPLAYSLDILLPLVDLGQEKRWGPLIPTPENNFCVELLSLSPPHWVRLLNWFQILYGWIASLLFVAIVSGMSRRSEMEK